MFLVTLAEEIHANKECDYKLVCSSPQAHSDIYVFGKHFEDVCSGYCLVLIPNRDLSRSGRLKYCHTDSVIRGFSLIGAGLLCEPGKLCHIIHQSSMEIYDRIRQTVCQYEGSATLFVKHELPLRLNQHIL